MPGPLSDQPHSHTLSLELHCPFRIKLDIFTTIVLVPYTDTHATSLELILALESILALEFMLWVEAHQGG